MSQGPPNLARTAKSMRAICEMTRKYHSNIVSMCLCTPHLHAKMFAQSLSKPWNIFENMCCMWTLFSCWKSVQIYICNMYCQSVNAPRFSIHLLFQLHLNSMLALFPPSPSTSNTRLILAPLYFDMRFCCIKLDDWAQFVKTCVCKVIGIVPPFAFEFVACVCVCGCGCVCTCFFPP
jgi:hypothetical protein